MFLVEVSGPAVRTSSKGSEKMISILSGLGLICLIVWLVAAFLLHKGGLVHVVLLIAISAFFFQFLQYRRTKQYDSEH